MRRERRWSRRQSRGFAVNSVLLASGFRFRAGWRMLSGEVFLDVGIAGHPHSTTGNYILKLQHCFHAGPKTRLMLEKINQLILQLKPIRLGDCTDIYTFA